MLGLVFFKLFFFFFYNVFFLCLFWSWGLCCFNGFWSWFFFLMFFSLREKGMMFHDVSFLVGFIGFLLVFFA